MGSRDGRRPQAHLGEGLLVYQHRLGWSHLCRSLYMAWILPALRTYAGGGRKRGHSQRTSCAPWVQAVCTHARKRIRNHLRQGCRSALPGGGQPSRAPTPRDRHPPRASPQRVRPVLGACRGGMRESRQAAVVPCQSFDLIHPSPHPNPRGPFR